MCHVHTISFLQVSDKFPVLFCSPAPDPIIMRAVVAKGHIGVYNRARITVVFCVSSKDEKTKLSRGVRDGLEDTIA